LITDLFKLSNFSSSLIFSKEWWFYKFASASSLFFNVWSTKNYFSFSYEIALSFHYRASCSAYSFSLWILSKLWARFWLFWWRSFTWLCFSFKKSYIWAMLILRFFFFIFMFLNFTLDYRLVNFLLLWNLILLFFLSLF